MIGRLIGRNNCRTRPYPSILRCQKRGLWIGRRSRVRNSTSPNKAQKAEKSPNPFICGLSGEGCHFLLENEPGERQDNNEKKIKAIRLALEVLRPKRIQRLGQAIALGGEKYIIITFVGKGHVSSHHLALGSSRETAQGRAVITAASYSLNNIRMVDFADKSIAKNALYFLHEILHGFIELILGQDPSQENFIDGYFVHKALNEYRLKRLREVEISEADLLKFSTLNVKNLQKKKISKPEREFCEEVERKLRGKFVSTYAGMGHFPDLRSMLFSWFKNDVLNHNSWPKVLRARLKWLYKIFPPLPVFFFLVFSRKNRKRFREFFHEYKIFISAKEFLTESLVALLNTPEELKQLDPTLAKVLQALDQGIQEGTVSNWQHFYEILVKFDLAPANYN